MYLQRIKRINMIFKKIQEHRYIRIKQRERLLYKLNNLREDLIECESTKKKNGRLKRSKISLRKLDDELDKYISTLKKIEPASLFVFFKLSKSDNWNYHLPMNWIFIGEGNIQPWVGEKIESKYTRDNQFIGPPDTIKETRKYLSNLFKELKKNKIVKYYKISHRYNPFNVKTET